MGNRRSRPLPSYYPPVEPLFIKIGCSGLTRKDYSDKRLDKAPFLYYKFTSANYADMKDTIIQTIFDIQNEEDRSVYGPIYLMSALNVDDGTIESYLYFPSMRKDMKKWKTYSFICMAHGWMYRILYNYVYRVKPYSSCSLRIDKVHDPKTAPQEAGFEYGCKTESEKCMQTDDVHKAMGIFNSNYKTNVGYPAIYFTTYQINTNDENISAAINIESLPTLQRNILTENNEIYPGCQTMLISPNKQYIFSLSNFSFGLYKNHLNEPLDDLCFLRKNAKGLVPIYSKIFKNFILTRMLIESGELNLYAKTLTNDTDDIIYKITLTSDISNGVSLILNDDGSLSVYDNNNKVINTVNLTTDGIQVGKDKSNNSDYNVDADYRQRLLNLLLYLKSHGLYKEVKESNIKIIKTMPDFDSSVDYLTRFKDLIKALNDLYKKDHDRLDRIKRDAKSYYPVSKKDLLHNNIATPSVADLNIFGENSSSRLSEKERIAQIDKDKKAEDDAKKVKEKEEAERGKLEDSIMRGEPIIIKNARSKMAEMQADTESDEFKTYPEYTPEHDIKIRKEELMRESKHIFHEEKVATKAVIMKEQDLYNAKRDYQLRLMNFMEYMRVEPIDSHS